MFDSLTYFSIFLKETTCKDMAGGEDIKVITNIGALIEFRIGEDWELYQERLEQYFVANFVEEQRQVSVLLTLIGPDTYKILRDLCHPVLP